MILIINSLIVGRQGTDKLRGKRNGLRGKAKFSRLLSTPP